jgi:hypothetical protein
MARQGVTGHKSNIAKPVAARGLHNPRVLRSPSHQRKHVVQNPCRRTWTARGTRADESMLSYIATRRSGDPAGDTRRDEAHEAEANRCRLSDGTPSKRFGLLMSSGAQSTSR